MVRQNRGCWRRCGPERSPQERAASSNTPAAPTSPNDGPPPAAEKVGTRHRVDEASALTCRRERVFQSFPAGALAEPGMGKTATQIRLPPLPLTDDEPQISA